MEIQQELLNALDIDYSYRLAKKWNSFALIQNWDTGPQVPGPNSRQEKC